MATSVPAPAGGRPVHVLLLLAVTALWGWTFVGVKNAISEYPSVPFLALRFGLAAVVMGLLVRRVPGARLLKVGAAIGAALAVGYLLHTIGLQYTSPGNAGLITGLFVVFTPLLERALGDPVPPRTYLAGLAALAGLALLTGGAGRPGPGDLLVLGCAVCFAVHIVLLSRFAPELPAAPLAMVQMAIAGLLFSAGGIPGFHWPSASVWVAIAITGVFASALAFLVQTWAQRRLTASRAALVLGTEPAWALLFAVLLAGQRFTALQATGAAVVLAAILGHEWAAARTTHEWREPAAGLVGRGPSPPV